MAARSNQSTPVAGVYQPAAVHGLEAGRELARRSQRSRRRQNRIVTALLMLTVTAMAGAAGWFAYNAYITHDNTEQLETDRRIAEIEQDRVGRSTDDIIEQLEQTPAWNGPGNPTFGVGGDSEP